MKDIKVLEGDLLVPLDQVENASPQIIVVRNNDNSGRRLGIFAKYGNADAGQRLNTADVLHEVKTVASLPTGYNSGVEVNLSGKREYQLFGTYYVSERAKQSIPGMKQFAENVTVAGESPNSRLRFSEQLSDISKMRTTLVTGDLSPAQNTAETKKNFFCTFTMIFAGTVYNIGLDIAKHLAHVTADLNMRLNRIHPQLRGFVGWSSEQVDILEFYIAVPDGLDVIFPMTTFPTNHYFTPTTEYIFDESGTYHLNKGLSNALLIDNTHGIRPTVSTITTVDNASSKKNVDQLISGAYVVNLNAFTHEIETPTLYKGRVTVPSSAFATLDTDERLNFAMLKLVRNYGDGRVLRLLSVRYKTSTGGDINFTDQYADLLLLAAPLGNGSSDPAIYLNELDSADNDELIGIQYPSAEEIYFAESGGLNEESAMYVGLLATPNIDNRNSIYFRDAVAATYLEIEYELVEADVIPTVKIDDLGTLDYHYIKTVEHAFLPIAFTTQPPHNWNIEFITEGQAERYYGQNNGPELGESSIRIATDGTVGEAVILANIDYSKVKLPTETEPNYHYTGTIGAETWLYQNLPYTNVVTTRAITAAKANYKVIFPDVAMQGTLTGVEEPLIAKQSDGSATISGRFWSTDYAKNVFLHSTSTTFAFSLNGQPITPNAAVTFDPSTGEFSVPFNVNDLVEPGPGSYLFRVSVTAHFPWLTNGQVYSETMNVDILPAVEGIEDDVTFVGTASFDKVTDGDSTGGYQLVDLDSGEVLASGLNAFALREDAIARGLVSVDLIFGDVFVPDRV